LMWHFSRSAMGHLRGDRDRGVFAAVISGGSERRIVKR